jgi:Ca2+-binding RTX toxin-like protein
MSRLVKVALMSALMLALSAGVALAATLVGTPGPDSFGCGTTSGDDQIFTLEGNDFVDACTGNDEVYGNENNDELVGAEDSDKVHGNTGKDTIDLDSFDTSGSSDQGFGGKGNDTVFAQDNHFDAIDCGASTGDKVFLDAGLDTQTNCEQVVTSSAASEPSTPPR